MCTNIRGQEEWAYAPTISPTREIPQTFELHDKNFNCNCDMFRHYAIITTVDVNIFLFIVAIYIHFHCADDSIITMLKPVTIRTFFVQL